MTKGEKQGNAKRKTGSALLYVLIFTFVLFIGILVVVYVITRQSKPVMLDEHGKPVASSCIHYLQQKGGALLG